MSSSLPVPIELTAEERAQLEAWERRRTSAHGLALRSRIVLATTEGPDNTEVARELGIAVSSVRKCRNRFAEPRRDGLIDEPRPGRPRTIRDDKVEEVIVKTLETTPKDATQGSTRAMAAEVGSTRPPYTGSGRRSDSRRIARARGSSPRTRSSSIRSATSSACI